MLQKTFAECLSEPSFTQSKRASRMQSNLCDKAQYVFGDSLLRSVNNVSKNDSLAAPDGSRLLLPSLLQHNNSTIGAMRGGA